MQLNGKRNEPGSEISQFAQKLPLGYSQAVQAAVQSCKVSDFTTARH
jgi:hypothetical protein